MIPIDYPLVEVQNAEIRSRNGPGTELLLEAEAIQLVIDKVPCTTH